MLISELVYYIVKYPLLDRSNNQCYSIIKDGPKNVPFLHHYASRPMYVIVSLNTLVICDQYVFGMVLDQDQVRR